MLNPLTTKQQAAYDAAVTLIGATRPRLAGLLKQYKVFSSNAPEYAAQWDRESKTFRVNFSYTHLDTENLAAVLLHEATHTADDLDGKLVGPDDPVNGRNWGINEIHAYEEQADFWAERFPNGRHLTEMDEQFAEQVEMRKNGTLWPWVHHNYSPMSFFESLFR